MHTHTQKHAHMHAHTRTRPGEGQDARATLGGTGSSLTMSLPGDDDLRGRLGRGSGHGQVCGTSVARSPWSVDAGGAGQGRRTGPPSSCAAAGAWGPRALCSLTGLSPPQAVTAPGGTSPHEGTLKLKNGGDTPPSNRESAPNCGAAASSGEPLAHQQHRWGERGPGTGPWHWSAEQAWTAARAVCPLARRPLL